ncbi:MAG: protein-L-isoaspartate O-methyltransferase family protein [Methyloligellaceae bacterium]
MSDIELARLNMVESQVRPSDVTDRRIMRAMSELPRDEFVPGSMRSMAYMDEDILIQPGSADSVARYLMAPRIFAKLVQLAEVAPGDVVLDVGCGSGYSIAVLSQLCESVVGIEEDQDLVNRAAKNFSELGIDNAVVLHSGHKDGKADEAPYDVIFMNGCIPEKPDALLEQLKDRGRLVTVIASGGVGKAYLFKRVGDNVSGRPAFDAAVPVLPGFEKAKEFVF